MRLTGRSLAALAVAALVGAGLSLVAPPRAEAAIDMAAAVDRASAHAASRGEQVGISVFDRDTGRTYDNGQLAHTRMRSASIPKILVAESLLDRSRRGEITLTQADRDLMWLMVARSDDAAMSNLYSRFGGQSMVMGVAAEYGLTEIGIPPTPGYWGMFQITAHDIADFYRQVVDATHLDPADRDQLITMMRSATRTGTDGFDQYFGIPYALPYQYWGIKQGWMCCQESMRRLHTSGILGQDNRYSVAVLSQMPSSLSYAYAAQTLTTVVQTLYPDGTIPPLRLRIPIGSLDAVREQSPGVFQLVGWTADADSPLRPLDVHVYVDGVLAAYGPAAGSRPDVGAAFPEHGDAHGFDLTVRVPEGRHTVCAYAINAGPAAPNPALGCPTVETRLSPAGNFEVATAVGLRGMRVGGWVLDPESGTAPSDVRFTVDGRDAATVTADAARPDVGAAFPVSGPAHGFGATLGMAWPGRHRICATAVNAPGSGGTDTPLACRVVDGPTGILGSFDEAAAAPGGIRVAGWVLDSLTPATPVDVHVYVDGRFAQAVTASGARPDVGAAFPEGGSAHGYDATVSAAAGAHQVCVYAIYADSRAANPALGCRSAVTG